MKIIKTTTDNEQKAEAIAEAVLKEKLAACVNIFQVDSHFWWKGMIEMEGEFQLVIKTKESLVEELIKKILQLHDYEQPVIEVIDVEKTNKGVEEWINEVTK